ncbi:MAG: DeoR/GlpR transcriptional regulator [Nocardia sp.]|nr:DeoR/GlpR transcriptional regulator [Nocardia sp.]
MTGTADRTQRRTRLLALLTESGRLTVAEAAQRLEVAPVTIRRDFAALADEGLAIRAPGCVIAAGLSRTSEPPVDPAIARIAEYAAALVEPADVVALTGGLSTAAIAQALAARTELPADPDRQLVIVTNALDIAGAMVPHPHMRTICLGGVARPESFELRGPLAELTLSQLRLDTVFLGVERISAPGGAQCRHIDEAGVYAEMVHRARQVVAVATADRIDTTVMARICPIEQVHRLITDRAADPDALARIRAAGVRVDQV